MRRKMLPEERELRRWMTALFDRGKMDEDQKKIFLAEVRAFEEAVEGRCAGAAESHACAGPFCGCKDVIAAAIRARR